MTKRKPRKPGVVKYRRAHSMEPQTVNRSTWYYEETRGISVVREVRDPKTDQFIRSEVFTIPWKMLEASMRRHEGKVSK